MKSTRDRHLDRLYKAVQNYVEKNGGKLVVIGPVQIVEWPGDRVRFCFGVNVKCLGRKPKKKKVEHGKRD